MLIHIPVFHGIAPRLAPRKLSNSQSQTARNCELFSEELRSIRDSIVENTPTKAGVKQSIYLLDGLWLHWTAVVDVARSPIYLENNRRIHYSGDYNPKSTDVTLAGGGGGTDYPNNFYRLGIPRPDTAPTVGHTGGTGNDIERSYIYTFVSAWGEEGPPSPVGTHTGKADATSWDITTIDATPPNSGTISAATIGADYVELTLSAGHFLETSEYIVIAGTIVGTGAIVSDLPGTWRCTRIDATKVRIPLTTSGTYTSGATWDREAPLQTTGWTKRLYRTLGGNFRFVDDGITGTTYTDITADEDLAELIPWEDTPERHWWKAPNGDMEGLIEFPGGILAGFFGNTLAFSEPNVPSAWPEEYQYKFNYDIVSIGVVGNTVVVTTNGFPSVVTGDHPAAMVQAELEIFQSCVSKRGTVSLLNGVMYPSPDGIVYVPSVGLPEIITRPFFKKKDWELFAPSTLVASLYDDRYYGFYTGGGEDGDENGAIIFDPKEPGATFTTLGATATAVHTNLETDDLYYQEGDNIVQYDSGGSYLTYTWLSKLFTTPKPVCFKAAKVKITLGTGVLPGDQAAAIAAAIAALELELAPTALGAAYGTANNYVSGAIAGGPAGEYGWADGPYADALGEIGKPVISNFLLYAHFDNGSGSIERHLVLEKEVTSSKPFRLPGGYLADQWEVELNCSDVRVHEVLLGTSMSELARL